MLDFNSSQYHGLQYNLPDCKCLRIICKGQLISEGFVDSLHFPKNQQKI